MLLNSYAFLLVFLPVVVVLYWVVPRGYPRLLFLVAASLVFYGLWDWRYVPLLLATTLVDWVAGHYLSRDEAEGASRRRKLILAAAITLNLAFLGYFKYRGFFVDRSTASCACSAPSEPLPAIRHAAADRHLVLHVRRHLVHRGRVPRRDQTGEERDPLPGLGHALPVHPRRPDHPLRPRRRPARARAAALSLGAHRHRPVLPRHGLRQEDARRRHDGALRERPLLAPRATRPALRLGGGPGLHAAAVLRLLRLQRHGGGRGDHDRPPLPAELRLAVQGGQPLGLLASLAHDPLRLAARLPVHPAGRVARDDAADRAEPHDHVPARWPLARPGLDVRLLGPPVGLRTSRCTWWRRSTG